jgi:hypothetical protein
MISKSKKGRVSLYIENRYISSKKYHSVNSRKKVIEDWLVKYKKLYPRQYIYINIKPEIDERIED